MIRAVSQPYGGEVLSSEGIRWTNKSVLALAGTDNPISVIGKLARELVLKAIDAGWSGPPFSPFAIADLLRIGIEANANIADARLLTSNGRFTIQFNPTQSRERVRFSIAHELAHSLFPDAGELVRNRGGSEKIDDDWQLEMLCNLAASELVMPMGSLPPRDQLPSIETLMIERRRFDVSAEAFLIRIAKISTEPVVMFCCSPKSDENGNISYYVDYSVPSRTAPMTKLPSRKLPKDSVVYACTAIGYTDKRYEAWFSEERLQVECVGIPGYPGSKYPRVAGLLRFDQAESSRQDIKFIHGDVFVPRGSGKKIICQLTNDQAKTWGGGVAKISAQKYPQAQKDYSEWFLGVPKAKPLGTTKFQEVDNQITLASIIAQQGYGSSETARIRYAALEEGLEAVASQALAIPASVHMPRIGTGQAGGNWNTIEEIIRSTLIANNVETTVYDIPPKRQSQPAGLFD